MNIMVRGELVIEIRPLVKREEISPEREYEFRIESVISKVMTGEREGLEGGFATQSKN